MAKAMDKAWTSFLFFWCVHLSSFVCAAPQAGPVVTPEAGHSNEALARRDYFFVGGIYGQHVNGTSPANGTVMTGQLYVEHLVPACNVTQKYPLVFWHGAAQTGTNWLNTPDGRQGWASYFLNQGYELVSSKKSQRHADLD